MNFTDVIQFIQNLGFPIFVAVWLLLRSDRIIKEHTKALGELTKVIQKCTK